MGHDEATHLREEIAILRGMIDAWLAQDADRVVLKALADVLHVRLERLEELEAPAELH